MASVAAASWGAQAMHNNATVTSRSSCCQCMNAMSRISVSSDQIMPMCKMGTRRARAYQKKSPVKKLLGKSSTPADAENVAMEGGKEVSEQGFELENGNVYGGVSEQVPLNTEEPSTSTYDVAANDVLQHAEADAVSLSGVESKSTTNTISEDESFIKIMEDLMKKVKDAEKNILTLNEARIQSLEQLEHFRRDNDALQGQLDVLQLQLAEADVKLKAATQEKARTKLLEEEVEALKGKLSENLDLTNSLSGRDLQKVGLSEQEKTLESEATRLAATVTERNQLIEENQMLHKELNLLQSELAKSSGKLETIAQLQQDRASLQTKLTKIEGQFATAESNAAELAKLKLEKQVALKSLQSLETAGPSLQQNLQTSGVDEAGKTAGLQDKVRELEALVLRLENENESLKETYNENERLKNQIMLLEQRLAESDAEIRAQMEIYQTELEAFQASLEKLKVEKSAYSGESKADDMPWEFWSHLLLSIDGWLLEKKLSLADGMALREIAWQRESRIRDVFVALKGQPEKDVIDGLLELLKANKRPGRHIVHIAAEMAPVAKVGGLGDVVTGLGRAFQKRDHLVEVVLPKYDCMDYSRISNLRTGS